MAKRDKHGLNLQLPGTSSRSLRMSRSYSDTGLAVSPRIASIILQPMLTYEYWVRRRPEFLLAQGIMSETSGPVARNTRRPRVQRAASASTSASSPIDQPPPNRLLVTPSPTPSPKTNKVGLDHLVRCRSVRCAACPS